MNRLIHGGDTYGHPGFLDFSSNINPMGLPDGVKKALIDAAGGWDGYPDPLCRDMTAALAKSENVPDGWIHFGNGAADLIFRVAQGVRPRRALTLAPTFAEYEAALLSVGCEVSFHALHEKDQFQLTDLILKKIDPALDLVMLCNPNNPTGHPAEPLLMERILKKCADNKILLLVDECFMPFLEAPGLHTMKRHLAQFPNLIVLNAFTKLYAMAGLRLGYLLCSDPKLIESVCVCEPPWNVSAPAQAAGIAALSDEAYIDRTRELITRERGYLTQELKKLGLTLYGSQANYLFFKCHNHRDLDKQLEKQEILIRSCGNYRGLDNRFYRVAVKDHVRNEKLISALGLALAAKGDA